MTHDLTDQYYEVHVSAAAVLGGVTYRDTDLARVKVFVIASNAREAYLQAMDTVTALLSPRIPRASHFSYDPAPLAIYPAPTMARAVDDLMKELRP